MMSEKRQGTCIVKLSELRQQRNITQEAIAPMVGVSLRQYQRIEAGTSTPSVKLAMRICEVLDADPREVDDWKP